MAEPGQPKPPVGQAEAAAEREATTNLAAFLHWLSAVHHLRLAAAEVPERALKRWCESAPTIAAALILRFAGPGFGSARIAAGLLLQADLRPDDRILVLDTAPDWLPQARAATRGEAATPSAATVLIAEDLPEALPPGLRRVILTGPRRRAAPPGVTLSHAADWTYPSESSAD